MEEKMKDNKNPFDLDNIAYMWFWENDHRKDKKIPINEKKQIVRFFLELHALGVKVASNGKWYVSK